VAKRCDKVKNEQMFKEKSNKNLALSELNVALVLNRYEL